MALIRMFTIRFRMEGAIGVVLLLLGLLGGVGMWSMLRIYDLHQDFIQVPWQQNQQLQQMQSKLDALQLKEKEVLITFSRSANLDDSYSQWKADVQAVQGQMQQIGQTMGASQKTHLEKLGQSVQAYVDGFGPLVQSLQANPYVSVEETLEAANVPYQHLLAAQQACAQPLPLPVGLAAKGLQALFDGLLHAWLLRGGQGSLCEETQQLARFYLQSLGLSAEK